MRANYQSRIAWVSDEIDVMARLVEHESGMQAEAQQRIYNKLTDLRLAAVAVMDSNQPIDALNRAVLSLTDGIRHEIALGPADPDLMSKIELKIERLKIHAQAVWDLCNPEL